MAEGCHGRQCDALVEVFVMPREMSVQDVQDVMDGFRDSAKRAVEAGVDVI